MALGFEPRAFRTHSCRRGGATEMARLGYSLPQIMLAGRWASDKSCKSYLQRYEVALANVRYAIDDPCWARLHSVAAMGPKVMNNYKLTLAGVWEGGIAGANPASK